MGAPLTTQSNQLETLESNLLTASLDALKEFNDKKIELTGMQAAQAASMLIGKLIDFKKAAQANFVENPVLPLATLIALGEAVKRAETPNPAIAKVIEI